MASSSANFSKIDKLVTPQDFVQWRRRVKAVISRDDPTYLLFQDAPEEGTEGYDSWVKANAQGKSTIILCLGDSALAKTRILVDGDANAKELWDELERIYTMSSTQAVANLQAKLESLSFKEGQSWESHISSFMSILDELAAQDQVMTESEKVTKILRTLPSSFDALAMASSLNENSFDQIVNAVQANIERRKKIGIWNKEANNSTGTPSAQYADGSVMNYSSANNRGRGGRGRYGRGRRGGRGGRGRFHFNTNSRTCHYCGKPGHFIKFCRLRISDEASGRIRKPAHQSQNSHGHNYNSNPNGGNNAHIQTDSWGGQNVPSVNMANATPLNDVPTPPAQASQFFPPQAHVVRFESKLASVGSDKTNDSFIDSGATHNFFHSKAAFETFDEITEQKVRTADGTSRIIGKGTVKINLGIVITLEAFYAPDFSSNIIASHILSEHFEVIMSSTLRPYKSCILMKKGILNTEDIVWETKSKNGLYVIPSSALRVQSALIISKVQPKGLEEYQTWHNVVGHISSERYQLLSKVVDDLPSFPRSVTTELNCIPCITGKMHKAPVNAVQRSHQENTEVHFDLSGPFKQSFRSNMYALHLMESTTSFSEVYAVPSKGSVSSIAQGFISKVNNRFAPQGRSVRMIRADNARENLPQDFVQFCVKSGISIEPSPPYAPESNGTAERLVQEHWTRARVLMLSTNLPAELWDEAILHANWLRNRTPSSRINNDLPLLKWKPNSIIRFRNIPEFGTFGYAFIYYPHNVKAKKLLPRSEPGYFVGVEGDELLFKIFIPTTKEVRRIRRADFHMKKNSPLPSISSLLDGISRQRNIEENTDTDNDQPEELLQSTLASLNLNLALIDEDVKDMRASIASSSTYIPHKSYIGISDGPPLPTSFNQACKSKDWSAAIDREYNALIKRGTWKYVKSDPNHPPVPFKWTFRAKKIDSELLEFLFKARCVLRGDFQTEGIDFFQDEIYAPVASHPAIRLFFSVVASEDLQIEGCDIDNAYLFGLLDIPIRMAQPTDSSQVLAMPGHDVLLIKSLYGAKQAGCIWGQTLHEKLCSMNFVQSQVEERIYYFVRGPLFLILCIVVDDIAFASNNGTLMNEFKQKLQVEFEVKLYGDLKSFIRWDITRTPKAIFINQKSYCQRLLSRFDMQDCNPVCTPLPMNADVGPCYLGETPLSPSAHHTFRAMVGGIAYLANSTRPDLSFAIGCLARSLHAPSSRHLSLAKRILRYIKQTMHYGLRFPVGKPILPSSLRAAVDADWGGCTQSRKSTTGYIFAVNGSPIFWKSKLQTIVALSSGEAEYVAISACARDITWLRRLVYEMVNRRFCTEDSFISATFLEVDSSAAISIASNKTSTKFTKHIGLKFHHARECIQNNLIYLEKVESNNQVADPLTKICNVSTLFRLVHAFSLNSLLALDV